MPVACVFNKFNKKYIFLNSSTINSKFLRNIKQKRKEIERYAQKNFLLVIRADFFSSLASFDRKHQHPKANIYVDGNKWNKSNEFNSYLTHLVSYIWANSPGHILHTRRRILQRQLELQPISFDKALSSAQSEYIASKVFEWVSSYQVIMVRKLSAVLLLSTLMLVVVKVVKTEQRKSKCFVFWCACIVGGGFFLILHNVKIKSR